MSDYLQCSLRWLMDTKTFQFVSAVERKKPCCIHVPFYLWSMVSECGNRVVEEYSKDGHKVYSEMLCETTVAFNNLIVEFHNGFKHAFIRFYDKIINGSTVIELYANIYNLGLIPYNGIQQRGMRGITYTMRHGNDSRIIQSDFNALDSCVREFKVVPGLGKHTADTTSPNKFCYGVVPAHYTIRYHGRTLDGMSMAFICGPWAILLDEDMTFDALVFLKGVMPHVLDIEQFYYTTSRYFVKVLTLIK